MAKEKQGDGRPLPAWRWWHPVYRSVMQVDHAGSRWHIDVDFFDWDEKVHLYRDGRLDRVQRGKARFELEDGARIEAAMSTYGLRRAHLVLPDGTERRLDPAPGTAERWRADLERDHPTASRRLAYVSWTVLVVALVLQVPQLLALGSVLTGWYEFTSPVTLPGWLDTVLSVGGTLAGIERALRLRYHWLLD